MRSVAPPVRRECFDAVLFDLDGVLTATASIHATCWKRMFDAFLQRRAAQSRESYEPFDILHDYGTYVDGRLREDGVRAFLASRAIQLPPGTAEDGPERETITGLATRKDLMVKELIAAGQVGTYQASIAWLRRLRAEGFKTAVVSASKNTPDVLRAAAIAELFETIVDGNVAARQGLAGKPAADTFLYAAKMLAVPPTRAVVVEDAISGVQAGRAGGFGLVIGVARHVDPDALTANGADLVVADLGELLTDAEPSAE